MTSSEARRVLAPLSGEGVLARYGDLVLLCTAHPDADERTAELLDMLAELAADGGDGRRLGRRLAGMLAGPEHEEFPTLVAFGPVGDGVAVVVHGDAEAWVTTEPQEYHLDGRSAVTWVDRVVAGPVKEVRAVLGDDTASIVDRWTRLDAGVVRAGGFVEAFPGAASLVAPAPVQVAAPTPAPLPPTDASAPVAASSPDAAPATDAVPAASAVVDADSAGVPEPEPGFAAAALTGVPAPRVSPAETTFDPTSTEAFTPEFTGGVPAVADAAVAGPGPSDVPATAPRGRPVGEAGAAAVPPVQAYAAPTTEERVVAEEPSAPASGLGLTVDRSAPFEAVLLVGAPSTNGQTTSGPLPPANVPVAPGPVPAEGAESADIRPSVLGIYCKNDHFNDPRAPYCAVCGISMVQLTHVSKTGPRPPLGVLVLDDGATFRLDTGYVVGREPDRDEAVVAGRSRALRIADPEGVVSRVHARVELDGWDVKVIDLGSANGTHLCPPNNDAWTRIPPHIPVPINPGTRVVFGRRGLRYESHRNP